MEIVSVNVGLPRELAWRGRGVTSGIVKRPVAAPVHAGPLGLAGDGQADPSVHGGPDKAVYAYPSEHYAFWREDLGRDDLGWGTFGENLTTRGLLEGEVRVGDRLRAGGAVLRVTQPREPCFKLGMRLGRADAVKRFARSGRSGFYLAVEREGALAAGDAIELLERDPASPRIAEVLEAFYEGRDRSLGER